MRPVQLASPRLVLLGQFFDAVFTVPLLEFTTDLTAPVADPLGWVDVGLFAGGVKPQQGTHHQRHRGVEPHYDFVEHFFSNKS